MDEKEIIREFKILASKLKKDDTIVYLEQAQKILQVSLVWARLRSWQWLKWRKQQRS